MSFQIDIDPCSRRVGRFVAEVVATLRRAFAEESQRTGLTQAKVAEVLGVDRSVINRRLNGESNLTSRTLAELAYAMGDREIVFELRKRRLPVSATQLHMRTSASLAKPTFSTRVESA